jgi:hypothetical protein
VFGFSGNFLSTCTPHPSVARVLRVKPPQIFLKKLAGIGTVRSTAAIDFGAVIFYFLASLASGFEHHIY